MKIRIARHTMEFEPILHFYVELLGLKEIGSFTNRHGYDGIVLGCPNCDWQLEFTKSKDKPLHVFDEDDLIVLYFDNEHYEQVIERLRTEKNIEFAPKNSYWEDNGKLFRDPEGHGVVVSKIVSSES